MQQSSKSDRTKQVQFRMPISLHNELRKLLIDKNMSMADLFNLAAQNYINEQITKKEIKNERTNFSK